MTVIAVFSILMARVIGHVMAQGAQDEADRAESRAELMDQVIEAIDAVPGVRGVGEVSFIEAEDTLTLTAVYLTRETGEIGYRAELLDVFRAVGEIMEETDVDIDQIALIPSVLEDSAIETAVTTVFNVRLLMSGRLSRTTFLAELEILPGEHQFQEQESGGDA
ncbi:MAG: hypothetical protein OHK0046_44530 [Anaerolineae bacterium]